MNFLIDTEFFGTGKAIPESVARLPYTDKDEAIAVAIEAVDDPEVHEVRVIDVETGSTVWASTHDDI